MQFRKSDLTIYALAVAVLISGCGYCAFKYRQASIRKAEIAERETARDHIRHADLYYWFAMMGRGSQAAIRGGQSQAELADADLAAELESGTITAESARAERRRLEGIWTDLRYQKNMYNNTFHGVFPWSHFMAKPTLFVDARATGSFEMLDAPWEIAVRDAVSALITSVLDAQTVIAQHDVVFVTDPDDFENKSELDSHITDPKSDRNDATWPSSDLPRDGSWLLETQLENEALYLFNMNPRFFVHNLLEVETTLTPDEHLALRRLEPTEEILTKLRADWGHNDLLVIRVKKMDEFDFHHFYSAQGRLYRDTSQAPAVIYNNYGFCRDRRHMFVPVLVFNGLMLITAIILFRFLAHLGAHDHQPPTWLDSLGLGAIAFVWGRVAVWGIAELVEEFVPDDEVLAILSFWWPAVTGFVILIGPALVMRFAEERFGWLSERFSLFNRGGALFAAVSVGSFAYVGQAALWVRAWGGWQMCVPLFIATIVAAWLIGRAFDSSDPVTSRWAIPFALLMFGTGPAFSNSAPASLWWVAVPMLAIVVPAARLGGRTILGPQVATGDEEDDQPIDSPDKLIHAAQTPPFQVTAFYEAAISRLTEWSQGKATVRLQLIGKSGVGKSAIVRALLRENWLKDSTSNSVVAVMHGTCAEPNAGATREPYQPFAEAIAGHFSVNLLVPPGRQLAGVDKAIDGIFEEVVPFSDLLFPPSHDHPRASGSRQELFHSVAIMLRQLARKRPVLLIIDDAHWIDDGSRELLDFLVQEFPAGGDVPLALIAATRESLSGFAADETVTISELSSDDVRALLHDGLKFAPAAAQQLAEAMSGQEGSLHWLFQMVIHMASHDALEWRDGGFSWVADTELSDHLPDDLLTSLQASLASHPEFRPVLECAACIGPEFTVSVLSSSLQMNRLDCVHLLDQIETQTGLIQDQHHDETFAFRSSFMLEALRKLLKVNAYGPMTPSPQRVREYHSQLATAWESTLDHSHHAVFRVATHRYSSGRRHAPMALASTLNAARAASAQYQHDLARQYIAMARECSSVAGHADDDLEQELLLIECHEAHIAGTRRVETAEKAVDWLGSHADAEIDVYVSTAQACYDAGIDTRDPLYFASCVAVAEEIVTRFESPLDQAEGHHFQGIGKPVTERDARTQHLNMAMDLVESTDGSLEALRLKSRICNSLGEQLSYGSDEDRQRAKQMFLTSVELKSRPSIRDVEGLAFAHGGLGRLAFFAPAPDFDEARKHFAEDLRYSEKIGSRTGQTKMSSLLGACDLRQHQDYTAALSHYESALSMAEERVDRFFALSGLLECCGGLEQKDGMTRYGIALVQLIDECLESLPEDVRQKDPQAAIPRMCLSAIDAGLAACGLVRVDEWYQRISKILSKEST